MTDQDYDVYLFKYKFDLDVTYGCIYDEDIGSSEYNSVSTKFSSSITDTLFDFYQKDSDLTKVAKEDYFYAYTSRYSGGFDLLDSFRIPRPCAYDSFNLTQMDYYRGQNAEQYKISEVNKAGFVITQMDQNSEFIYQNGTNASYIGFYDQNDYSVWIQTDDEDAVGVQKTVIRNCNALQRLLELNLYVNVLSNTYPDFTEEIETTYTLTVGDVFYKKLPPVVDKEGNDDPEVRLDVMEAQEDKYPPFLTFENNTNTLIMRPDSKYYAGQTYYFTIIVKEKNSETVLYPYYCTIKMTGEIFVPNTTIDYFNFTY